MRRCDPSAGRIGGCAAQHDIKSGGKKGCGMRARTQGRMVAAQSRRSPFFVPVRGVPFRAWYDSDHCLPWGRCATIGDSAAGAGSSR